MAESNLNNAAGRLHRLLVRGKKIDQNKKIREAWIELLEVEDGDNAILLRRLGYVLTLPSEIRTLIRQQDGIDHDLYLSSLPRIERALVSFNFGAQWKQVVDWVDDASVQGLAFCNDLLQRVSSESDVDIAELAGIRDDTESLLHDVETSDIDPDLRAFMTRHLLRILRRMEEYPIRGPQPVREAVAAAVGESFFSGELRFRSVNDERGKRFWDILGRIAIALTILTSGPKLLTQVSHLLPDTTRPQTEETSPHRERGVIRKRDELPGAETKDTEV